MIDKLRATMRAFLADHATGIVCVPGTPGVVAQPIGYETDGLQLRCRLPAWCDTSYFLAEQQLATVIITDHEAAHARWMQYIARAEPAHAPDPADPYCYFLLIPRRIDLIDMRQGWGARSTLECS